MFSHIFDFAGVVFQLFVLAAVLGFVGFKLRGIINSWSVSRRTKAMESEAVVAAARARAAARRAVVRT